MHSVYFVPHDCSLFQKQTLDNISEEKRRVVCELALMQLIHPLITDSIKLDKMQ